MVEDEPAALLQSRPSALEMADPELGPLKIEQDGGWAPEFFLQRADVLDQLRLLLPVAVAHVDPERVRPGEQKPAYHLRVARRRTERRQDLHLARAWRKKSSATVSPGDRARPP